MSVFFTNDKKELILNCCCGCDSSIKFTVQPDSNDDYVFISFLHSDFYTEQEKSFFRTTGKKLKKIKAILTNKDYNCNELVLKKDDFNAFVEYINNIK